MNERSASGRSWAVTGISAVALSAALFLFYFPVYRLRGFRLPLGFDASWYIWRANFASGNEIGPLRTAARPGHELLSAVLGSLSGLSQFQLAVVLPFTLAAMFALAMAALSSVCLGEDTRRYVITVAVAGTLLGTTRLVGENLANLLNLLLIVAALAALCRLLSGERGFSAAVVLLVASGLAHWLFLAVFGAVMVVTMLWALPASLRWRERGVPLVRTEVGALAGVGAVVAALMLVTITWVLRTPFLTFEMSEDPLRFLPKLRTDLSLLPPWLLLVATVGAGLLLTQRRRQEPDGARRGQAGFLVRVLASWVVVAAAGLIYGALTLDLPPHRFLPLFIVPGTFFLATAVDHLGTWLRGRLRSHSRRRTLSWGPHAVSAVAVAVLAIPGAMGWYSHGPAQWLDPSALRQAMTAGRYMEGLPEGEPVVYVVGPRGRAGVVSVPLKERTIRAGLPGSRAGDAYMFVGEPDDLLAGRRTVLDGPLLERAALPYWRDVKGLLPHRPPALILKALASRQYRKAVSTLGASEIGQGVALLRGPKPPAPLAAPPLPAAVPTVGAGLLWAVLLLALLSMAGAGWVLGTLGWSSPPQVVVSLAPAFGAAALMLLALVANKAGVGLAGPGGVGTYAAAATSGLAMAWLARVRERRRRSGGAGLRGRLDAGSDDLVGTDDGALHDRAGSHQRAGADD